MTASTWASGDAYEPYIGRWSRLVAREFVAWLATPPGATWLDVGCGTGALTEAIIGGAAPDRVHAVDPSVAYVTYARRRIGRHPADLVVADARALPHRPASIDVAASGLALNFVPEPDFALGELQRVVRPGGIVAAYVWDYAGRMELIRRFWDAAVALDESAGLLDEGLCFPMCEPAALERLVRDAGFGRVESKAIDVPTRFRDFDDYWAPFLGGQGPAPSYVMRLGEPQRVALRERLRASLPISTDGSIDLVARAWAVRGWR